MKKILTLFRFFALCAFGLAVFAACSSGPPVIPEDLSVLQFFQRAQEEAEYDEWENALAYYQTFIDRHPEDLPNVTAARYEIAFIQFKQENYEDAARGFRELLDFYDRTDLPLSFPLWPRVLSRKVIQRMQDENLLQEEPSPEDGAPQT